MENERQMYVSASEIGEFVYCPRAWWLKFSHKPTGVASDLTRGQRIHDKLGVSSLFMQRIKLAAWIIVVICVLALITVVWSLLS